MLKLNFSLSLSLFQGLDKWFSRFMTFRHFQELCKHCCCCCCCSCCFSFFFHLLLCLTLFFCLIFVLPFCFLYHTQMPFYASVCVHVCVCVCVCVCVYVNLQLFALFAPLTQSTPPPPHTILHDNPNSQCKCHPWSQLP